MLALTHQSIYHNVSLTVVLSPTASNGGSKRINLGGRPGLLPVPNLLLPLPRPRPLDLRGKWNNEQVAPALM